MFIPTTQLTTASGLWDGDLRRGSDKTITSSTTLEDDGVLQFTVVADTVYYFELLLAYVEIAGSGTPDIKYAFAVSTGSFDSTAYRNTRGLGGTSAAQNLSTNDMTSAVGAGTNAEQRMILSQGWFGVTAPALVTVQWAQNTLSGNGVTVLAGSVLRWKAMS